MHLPPRLGVSDWEHIGDHAEPDHELVEWNLVRGEDVQEHVQRNVRADIGAGEGPEWKDGGAVAIGVEEAGTSATGWG